MILLLSVVFAVAWGLVRGGSLSRLQSLQLHGLGLIPGALGIQIALLYLPLPTGLRNTLDLPLLAVSYGLLAAFACWNRRLPGMWLMGLGLLGNALVILANGGHMPITYEALVASGRGYLVESSAPGTLVYGSKDVLLPLADTNLWLLSDIFVVPRPFPVPSVFSLGDALIALGVFRLIPFALQIPLNRTPAVESESV